MKKIKHREAIKIIATILANVAVIGYGLAIYQQKWAAFIAAIIATKFAVWIAWRLDDDN